MLNLLRQRPGPDCVTAVVSRHKGQILSIDARSYALPWDRADLDRHLEGRSIGLVVEYRAAVLGYVVFRYSGTDIEVERLATHREHRRKGVASLLVGRLINQLGGVNEYGEEIKLRDRITLTVPDDCLLAHLMLRRLGFKATMTMRDYYERPEVTDAYRFVYSIKVRAALREWEASK